MKMSDQHSDTLEAGVNCKKKLYIMAFQAFFCDVSTVRGHIAMIKMFLIISHTPINNFLFSCVRAL